ncbi:hypothetical protein GC098_13615 [Paenibacillus sp. LMG 31458]|uniref:Solute-binding protein family 5 domain-containing protein n=1 Tax=Paenibacillus phytorum TaxID=2654977 RepID=A0ABX1XV85_9BACL|nr:ABC transporter substrate-binding protein [Paenibacillus phytorum]NOU72453.1 hypothetical protein [Paenibacillus phytorum]
MKKIGILSCITLFIVTLLAACSNNTTTKVDTSQSSDKSASNSKKIIVGITNAPGSFNPINAVDHASVAITDVLFQPLVQADDKMNFVPMLAQTIDTKDNQTFTVKLQPNAKWTDGQPVTADDVLFTVKLIANPDVISENSYGFSILDGFDSGGKLPKGTTELKSVKKVDAQTLEFKTANPVDANLFKEKVAQNIKTLPLHVLKDADPKSIETNPFMQKPNVVNGPFKLVKYAKDQYVELEANADYFKGAPKVKSLFFKIMPSANLVAQLQSGEIDMNFPGIGNIDAVDYDKVKTLENITVKSGVSLDTQIFIMNTLTINDAKLRQAIVYAINRKTIVDSLLKGFGQVIDGPYTPAHPYFNKNLQITPYDPEKAKQLLKEANWDASKTLTMVVPTGNKVREQTADIFAENLKAVGIKAKIEKFDISTVVGKAIKHDFDLLMLGSFTTVDPDVSAEFKTGGVNNFSAYSNKEMDALIDQGMKETDPSKREVIYDKIQEVLERDRPGTSIYAQVPFAAVSKKVIVGEPKQIGMLINVHEWDVNK